MEGGLRIDIQGLGEATKQLQDFDKIVKEFAKSGSVSQANIDSLVKQMSQRAGGLDPYRSGRDLETMRGAVGQGSEGYKSMMTDASEAIKVLENSIKEATKDLGSKGLSEGRRDDITSMIAEMSFELEDYNEKLKEASNSLEVFNKVVSTVSEENRQITSGARADTAPAGQRRLGTLEALNIKTARNTQKLMRASNKGQRNLFAYRHRENQKRAQDIYSDKILTTNQRAVFSPVYSGVNNVIQGVGQGVGGSFGELANLTTSLARDAREIFTLDLPKAIGAVATTATNFLAGYAQMVIPKGMELEDASMDAIRTTGGVSGVGLYGMGLNTAETNRAMIGTARAIGVSGNQQNLTGLMSAEYGAGLEQGGLQPVLDSFKYFSNENRTGSMAMENQLAKMVGILDDSQLINASLGDFTRMGEATQLVGQVNAMQTGRSNFVDMRTSAGIVGGLERIGGTFRGEAGMAKFQAIDRAITNPDNQFKEAVVLRALSEADPNMSMRELRKRQQKGATDPQNFDVVMKKLQDISGAYGGNEDLLKNDLFVENVSKMFTQGMIEPAEALIRSRNEKTGAFDVFAPKTDNAIYTQGRGQRSGIIQANKMLDDELAKRGTMDNPIVLKAMESSIRLVQDPMKELARLSEEGKKASAQALSDFWGNITGSLGKLGTDIGKGVYKLVFGDNNNANNANPNSLSKAKTALQNMTGGGQPEDKENKSLKVLERIEENTKKVTPPVTVPLNQNVIRSGG